MHLKDCRLGRIEIIRRGGSLSYDLSWAQDVVDFGQDRDVAFGGPSLSSAKSDPRDGGAAQLFESTPQAVDRRPHPSPSSPPQPTMLSRTIRRSIASPFRRNVIAPAARPAFRFVTTDAASSHTDPANVPSVREDSIDEYRGQRIDRQQEDDKPFEIRLSDEAFETYELDPPPYTMDVTKKELKKMYYDMVAVRYECPAM
jgi:hypothetical protein